MCIRDRPEDVVWFGVLTLLGSAMLLTAALDPLLRRVPPAVGVAVSALLFWGTYPTMNGFWNLPGGRLALPQALYASYTTAYLGFMPKSFFSTDYFPLLPWLFLFWTGYFLSLIHISHLFRRGRPRQGAQSPPDGGRGRYEPGDGGHQRRLLCPHRQPALHPITSTYFQQRHTLKFAHKSLITHNPS